MGQGQAVGKYLLLVVLLIGAAYARPVLAGDCTSIACGEWQDCVDPDDAKTANMCEDQAEVARHFMDNVGKAELYAPHETVIVCKDYAACTRMENGSCGWKPLKQAYFDCAQHPTRYDK